MKRTKQLQAMVDRTNEYLKNNHIKDEGDSAFMVVSQVLLDTHTYKGYNMYKDKTLADGTVFSVLAGTDDPDKFDYLQLY